MTSQVFTDGVSLSASSWATDVDTAAYSYLTSPAGQNTLTATGPTSMTAYAAGQIFRFTPVSTNTVSTTLNITANSVALGAKNIFLRGAALVGGEIIKSQPVEVMYDGTQFNIVGNSAWGWISRSHLAGLTLSTAGSSTTITTAAGMAADSSSQVLMAITSAIGKTTSAWAVGTGNGGLDTGAIATSTWYHVYLIQRPDTGVVDVLVSLSASAPTMPTSYTYKRRIGSAKTDGSSNWTAFVQDGDYFRWLASVADVSSVNPGTSAVTRTLTVPTGVNVVAITGLQIGGQAGGQNYALLSDLGANDEAASAALSTVGGNQAAGGAFAGNAITRTNTSAQVRSRIFGSDGGTTLVIQTFGWIDRRGRDS